MTLIFHPVQISLENEFVILSFCHFACKDDNMTLSFCIPHFACNMRYAICVWLILQRALWDSKVISQTHFVGCIMSHVKSQIAYPFCCGRKDGIWVRCRKPISPFCQGKLCVWNMGLKLHTHFACNMSNESADPNPAIIPGMTKMASTEYVELGVRRMQTRSHVGL